MLRPVLGRLRRPETAALMGYSATAFIYFGRPIAAHPGRTIIGHGGDPGIFVWSLAWWPHALLHGENPIYTHAIWAPSGIDLAWVACSPGLALALAPITLANSDRRRSTSVNQSAAEIFHGSPRRSSAASPAARTACNCGARFAVLK